MYSNHVLEPRVMCDMTVHTNDQSVQRLSRSKSPLINAVAREISLDLTLATRSFYGHVAGKENVWADALSRIAEPDVDLSLPEPLRLLPRVPVPVRDQGWWRCDLPCRDAET